MDSSETQQWKEGKWEDWELQELLRLVESPQTAHANRHRTWEEVAEGMTQKALARGELPIRNYTPRAVSNHYYRYLKKSPNPEHKYRVIKWQQYEYDNLGKVLNSFDENRFGGWQEVATRMNEMSGLEGCRPLREYTASNLLHAQKKRERAGHKKMGRMAAQKAVPKDKPLTFTPDDDGEEMEIEAPRSQPSRSLAIDEDEAMAYEAVNFVEEHDEYMAYNDEENDEEMTYDDGENY